jgi:rubrerythrin
LGANPALHARFINTISFMEYVGARKIMKSQMDTEFDLELLSHVAEEAKHAWLVKRLALRVDQAAAETYGPEHLLCPDEAEGYLQSIDAAAEAALADVDVTDAGCTKQWLNYLYSSLLIEERADTFYKVYAVVLEEIGLAGTVRSILKDETKHLAAMAERIERYDVDARARLAGLRVTERAAFARWEKALWSEIHAAAAAAAPPSEVALGSAVH